jgi:hypothetical protein
MVMHLDKYLDIPEGPQLHFPVADTVLLCWSLAIWGNQPMITHLSTGHAETYLAAMTGASDMRLSASTQSHAAARTRCTQTR